MTNKRKIENYCKNLNHRNQKNEISKNNLKVENSIKTLRIKYQLLFNKGADENCNFADRVKLQLMAELKKSIFL